MKTISSPTATFERFVSSEKAGGLALMACAAIAIAIANSPVGDAYAEFWHTDLGGLTIEHWVNDGLMALFFLLIGLELERELYVGELSDPRKAALPVVAACGGVLAPALIHLSLNGGTPTQAGVGIPMATDIAFALAVLALLGSNVPTSLKVFLTALAVIDDLIAIVVIAVFYSMDLSWSHLAGAVGVFGTLIVLNRLRVMSLLPYLVGGGLLWFLLLRSGVHATLAGVALAFAIPFTGKAEDEGSPSHRLERSLQRPVAFVVLPAFALVNTAVVLDGDLLSTLASPNAIGIMTGLTLGKPLGIALVSFAAISAGICAMPSDLRWKHIIGAGILGGIGFTMSIFITNLAFAGDPALVDSSKAAVLVASLTAGTLGYSWLKQGPTRG